MHSFVRSLPLFSILACGSVTEPSSPDPMQDAPTSSDAAEVTTPARDGGAAFEATVFGTDGQGLRIREAPTTSSAVVGQLDEGAPIEITCQIDGDAVGATTIWDYLEARGGYVSDAFVHTGYDSFVPGVPRCADVPPAQKTPVASDPPSTDPAPEVDIDGPPVRAHVQQFANAECRDVGECLVSTYEGHQPIAALALDNLISDHYGDLPTDDFAFGTVVADYALEHQAEYRIWYVIFRQHINYGDGDGWQQMEDRGSITQNHYDHVHVSFYE